MIYLNHEKNRSLKKSEYNLNLKLNLNGEKNA